mgnify:CR=1 FL=1
MNRWIFIAYTLIIAWLATSCDFHELPEAVAPVKIRGILMATPDSGAAFETLTFLQITTDGEFILHGSATTDASGFFEFEYPRNNKMNGGKRCKLRCSSQCPGLQIWHNETVIATCFPTNKRLDLELYLSNSVNLTVTVGTEVLEGDSLFVSLVPMDTNHPNYSTRESSLRGNFEFLLLPGPIDSGTSINYRTRMDNSRYEGSRGNVRGESLILIAGNFRTYSSLITESRWVRDEPLFGEDFGFTRQRFRGEPFRDNFTILTKDINW